jgi:hypothetical protein
LLESGVKALDPCHLGHGNDRRKSKRENQQQDYPRRLISLKYNHLNLHTIIKDNPLSMDWGEECV